MNDGDPKTLREHINQIVRIRTQDGEVLVARVLFVSDSEEDVTYDLISTSRESQYEKHDEQPVYLITFKDIASVEVVADSGKDII